MLQFVCDNSSLSTIYRGNVPNILLIGGFLLHRDIICKLVRQVRAIKDHYCGDPYAPVKWNLKDLKKTYYEWNDTVTFYRLMNSSKELRTELMDKFSEAKPLIFFSVIDIKVKGEGAGLKEFKRLSPGSFCKNTVSAL